MFLIIKNIFKVKIHFFFYITMMVALFTGNIIDFLNFTSIILIHEFGHLFGAFLFKWNIDKIIILPFGGLTIFNQKINTSLFQQFIVTILGPLFQFFFFFVINFFFDISSNVIYYNFILLVFNLFPIYPLDGSKLIYIILCYIFPFKISHLLMIVISIFFIIFVFCFISNFDFLIFLIMFFLLKSSIKELCDHKMIFNKFLLERYNYNFDFKKTRFVKNINYMYFCYRHVFLMDKKYITEKNMLRKRFDKYNKL